jgi:cytochrome b subunit of formate dehydrogenase
LNSNIIFATLGGYGAFSIFCFSTVHLLAANFMHFSVSECADGKVSSLTFDYAANVPNIAVRKLL